MSKEEKQVEQNPREVKLADGRTLTITLNALSWREVREYVNGVMPYDPENPEKSEASERRHAELKGKACGLTADEVLALGFEDFSRISKKISDLIVNPVEADPN